MRLLPAAAAEQSVPPGGVCLRDLDSEGRVWYICAVEPSLAEKGRCRDASEVVVDVDVLTPSSPLWGESLEFVEHDVYHLPGYVGTEASRLGGEPVAIRVTLRDRMLILPLILRPLPYGVEGIDAISPYGYPGPLLTQAALADDSFVDEAGAALARVLRDQDCCTVFVRGHPLLPHADRLFAGLGRLRLVGSTVWLDLEQPAAERWAGIDSRMRNTLRRNARDGVVVTVDEEWGSLGCFVDLYHDTMNRVGADDSYRFDIDYFAALKEELGGRAHLMLARSGGSLVGAGLFTEVRGIIQFHLAGIKVLRASSPSAALIHFASVWGADRGNRILHLGGGHGGRVDGLLRFKSHFSRLRGSFYAWEIVLDHQRFEHVARLNTSVNHHDGSAENPGFFPAYRRI